MLISHYDIYTRLGFEAYMKQSAWQQLPMLNASCTELGLINQK